MTLEQLLDMDADKLLAMPDEELKKHFEQFLVVTRPDKIVQQKENQMISQRLSPKAASVLAKLQSEGIELTCFNKKRKI